MSESNPVPGCTLGDDDLSRRMAEWREIAAQALIGQERLPNAVELHFRGGGSTVATLTSLVEAEQGCCAWASWRMVDRGATVDVYATGPADQITALATAFEGLVEQ